MLRAWWIAVAVGLFVVAVASASGATLPPEAYEQQRASAPVILEGAVQNDPGGRMALLVQRVIRGPWRPGQSAIVRYPALVGPTPPPGAATYYRPFVVGTRLRVFARPGQRELYLVDAGIDVLTRPPRQRGGCASCAMGTEPEASLPWLGATLLGLLWALRRGHRLAFLVVAGCGSSLAPSPPPAPTTATPPPPAPVVTESEGETRVTVLSRPDHPAVRTAPAAPKPARTDADCRASPACKTAGQCSAVGSRCVADRDEDCLRVPVCAAGRCQRRGDRCEPTSCAAGWACRAVGACDDERGRCVPSSSDHCAGSVACRDDGRCQLERGACLALDDDDCAESEACRIEGRCEADNGRCVAADSAACRASKACRGEGRCTLRNGYCVERCEGSRLCKAAGLCSTAGGGCIATSEAHCAASESCRSHGRCSMGLSGTCVAADDVDCRQSRSCREEGRCSHRRGRCLPGTTAECRQALVACKVQGRCREQEGRCVE